MSFTDFSLSTVGTIFKSISSENHKSVKTLLTMYLKWVRDITVIKPKYFISINSDSESFSTTQIAFIIWQNNTEVFF